jgi:hypothetical protein
MNELEELCKKAVIYVNILSHHFPLEMEENHERPWSGYLISKPPFKALKYNKTGNL